MSIRKYLVILPFFMITHTVAAIEQTELYENAQKNFNVPQNQTLFEPTSIKISDCPIYFPEEPDDITVMIDEMNEKGEFDKHQGPKQFSKIQQFFMKYGGKFFIKFLELRNSLMERLQKAVALKKIKKKLVA